MMSLRSRAYRFLCSQYRALLNNQRSRRAQRPSMVTIEPLEPRVLLSGSIYEPTPAAAPESGPQVTVGLPALDVWQWGTDPQIVGQIETIRTAESGAQHYNYFSDSAHPSGVSLADFASNLWIHQDTNSDDLTFGFAFDQDDGSNASNTAQLNFRIVGSEADVSVSQSDDPGEAIETDPGAFVGNFSYGVNTDGIAVSGISGVDWTIIIDSVDFGNVTTWRAANGAGPELTDDLSLQLGEQYRIVVAGQTPAGVEVNPSVPTNPNPLNGATDAPVNTTLTWNVEEPTGLVYDVFFGTQVDPPMVSDDQTTMSFDPGPLDFNTTYFWKVVAQDGALTFDSEEWSFTTLPVPDLVPSNLASPTIAEPGREISVDWTLSNNGSDLAAAGWRDGVYFSNDDQFDGADQLIGSFSHNTDLGVAANQPVTVQAILPDVADGNYWLFAVTDDQSQIVELNESNNFVSAPIQINAAPTITSVTPVGHVNTPVSRISLELSEPVDGQDARDENSYNLINLGPDQSFGGGDDLSVNVTANYLDGTTGVQLLVTGTNLVNLNNWAELDYDEGAAGDWRIEDDGSSVKQFINGTPTFFASDFDFINGTFAGRWIVEESGGDDDFIGLAFALNADNNTGKPDSYYVITWKQNTQNAGGFIAEEGLKLLKVTASGQSTSAAMNNSLWDGENGSQSDGTTLQVLATQLSSTLGWQDRTEYDFNIGYDVSGQIDVTIRRTSDGFVVWDTSVVDPDPLGVGKAAFFNHSQSSVRYSGLQQADALPDGFYELTVQSGDPGLRDPVGMFLDGDGNGVGGDDFVASFVVDQTPPVVEQTAISLFGVTVQYVDFGGMDPTTVEDLANYRLLSSGGDGTFDDGNEVDHTSMIGDIVYDPDTGVATLRVLDPSDAPPAQAPGITSTELADELYELTINGTSSVSDLAGNVLDGDGDGSAGGDHLAMLTLDIQTANASVDLQSPSDTGTSDTDNITSNNTPTFDVTVNEGGSGTFEVLGDDNVVFFSTPLGFATGGTQPIVISPALSDGEFTARYTFTAVTPNGSPAIADLPFTIDTQAPSVTEATISPNRIVIQYADNQDMAESLVTDPANYTVMTSGGDTIFNNGNELLLTLTSVVYDAGAQQATLQFGQPLEDEIYSIGVSGNITDQAGIPLTGGPFNTQLTLSTPGTGEIDPVSYDMLNGQQGTFLYRDDTYSVDGVLHPNATVLGGSLTGGSGQLTDDVLGANDWTADLGNGPAFEWVGWSSIQPVITFDLGSVVDISSVSFHANNFTSPGDVALPGTITLEFSDDGSAFSNPTTLTTTAEQRADKSVRWLALPVNLASRFVRATLTDGNGPWIFLSEVDFQGLADTGVSVDLNLNSDTGVIGDGISNETLPSFDVTVANPGQITVDYTGDGVVDESLTVATSGTYTFTPANPLAVGDGQIDVTFSPAAGTPSAATFDYTIETTPPTVTAVDPPDQGDASFTISFSESLDILSFDPSTVSLLDPIENPVSVDGVSLLPDTNNVYRIDLVEPILLAGEYTLTVGPDVTDVAGNLLDGDGDGTPGPAFATSFTVVDVTPPTVIDFQPTGLVNSDVSQLTVTFSEAILASTFDASDVVVTTPTGLIAPANITVTPVDPFVFNITIPTQTTDGNYTVEIGPDITDLAGNSMGQGQAQQRYGTDFENGVDPVWNTTSLSDFGITTSFLGQFDNQTASLVLDQLSIHTSVTVVWDLLIMDSWDGDTSPGPDFWGFNVVGDEGNPVFEHTFSNFSDRPQSFPGTPDVQAHFPGTNAAWQDSIYQSLSQTFNHSGNELQIDFFGRNLQGVGDEGWGIDNVRVFIANGDSSSFTTGFTIDQTGPQIVNVTPSGEVNDPFNNVEVTFSESIDSSSFSIADVTLTTPGGGTVGALAVNVGSDNSRFEITFPQQNEEGSYSLNLGPQVADLAGNVMDQDGDGIQGEETDDVFISSLEILLSDLLPDVLNGPSSATVGATIAVDWTVRNDGVGSARSAWSDRVYLSNDNQLDGADILLGAFDASGFSPLSPGADYSLAGNVTLPANILASDTWHLLVVTDEDNGQFEANESNNVISSPLTLNAPDLTPSDLTAPATGAIGETIRVDWTVVNISDTSGALGDWVDAVYLSSDEALGDDVLLKSASGGVFSPLNAGADYQLGIDVDVPGDTLPGQYFILLVTDDTDQQNESNESNNIRSISFEVSGVDLTVESVSVDTQATFGDTIDVTYTVRNTGGGRATALWSDSIWLSADSTFDSNDQLLGTFPVTSVSPLDSGDTYQLTLPIELPLDGSSSDAVFHIFVQTDSGGNQPETNATNNEASQPINLTLPPLPDLVVTDISTPSVATSGDTIDISWTVTNQGDADFTGNFADQMFLSSDTSLGSDLFIGRFDFSGVIPAGQSVTRTQTIDLPVTLQGDRFAIIRTDAANQVFEHAGENNNVTVDDQAITVDLVPLPNLVVTSITPPATVFSGQETVLQWTVANTGTGATSTPVWFDSVYLSLDSSLDGSDRFLGRVANPSFLGANDSYINSLEVQIPQQIDGSYFFIVVTDSSRSVFEFQNENDNVTAGGATQIDLAPPPDLRIDSVNAPAQAFSGQTMNLGWSVINNGNGDTAESFWSDRVFMSEDDVLDGDDLLLTTAFRNGVLAASETYSVNRDVTLPIGVSGDFFFIVQTDAFNQVFESAFELNNTGFDATPTTIILTPPPDLEVVSVIAPTTAVAGRSLTVDFRIDNLGATETPNSSWIDRLYLSTDDLFNADQDTLLASRTHFGALEPSEFYSSSITATLTNGLGGDFFLFVVTDATDGVFELDNDNNAPTNGEPISIEVRPPDLSVVTVTAPAAALAGMPLSVDYRVQNIGTADTISATWEDRLYLSSDTTFDPANDLLLESHTHFGVLDPGASYDNTITGTLPNGVSGNFFAYIVTDAQDSVFELNNTNNLVAATPAVTVDSRPADLVVTEFLSPDAGTAGGSILVSWTVTNQGLGDITATSWTDRIVISTDDVVGNDDDTVLDELNRDGPLTLGQDSTVLDRLVQIPFSLTPGSYRLFVITDAENAVFEANQEGNNVSTAGLITLERNLADLRVTQVSTSTSQIVSGGNIVVDWTVENLGVASTNSTFWFDDVYLSSDNQIDVTDVLLGSVQHSNPLTAGGQYTTSNTFALPPDISGDFFLIVRTDATDLVIEGALEINNDLATTGEAQSGGGQNLGGLEIALSTSPDLVVSEIDAPFEVFTGQSFNVSWTVRNDGDGVANRSWYDAVYLSLDQVFDRNTDLSLGFLNRTQDLGPGEQYTQTGSFIVPSDTSGSFFVFVTTDGGNQVHERNGEVNNAVSVEFPMQVIAMPPSDLVVGTIVVPTNAVPGQSASITYTVENQGFNPALGRWFDSIYISADDQWDLNDAFFGRALHNGDVPGGESYSETLTAALPGVVPGDYHVIIRSDIRNNIQEINEENNIGGSLDRVEIDVEGLTDGVPVAGSLSQGQSVYYRIDVSAGQTLRVELDGDSSTASNELFVRYGDVPSRTKFDRAFESAFSADQQIVIPTTLAGTYYVQVFAADTGVEPNSDFSINADIIEFSVLDIESDIGSNRGQTTLVLSGAQFTPQTVATLESPSGQQLPALQTWWVNESTLWATFDLIGTDIGLYDVQIQDGARTSQLEDRFEVTDGAVGELVVNLTVPANLRPGRGGIVKIEYGNTGLTDLVAPAMFLQADGAVLKLSGEASFGGSTLDFLAINPDGPAGILTPGAQGSVLVVFAPTVNTGGISFDLSASEVSDDPMDLDTLFAARPDHIGQEAWAAVFDNFSAAVGTTVGSFLTELSFNATRLSQLGITTNDIPRLLMFELAQADNITPRISTAFEPGLILSRELLRGKNATVSPAFTGEVDASTSTGGVQLSFGRVFQHQISRRYEQSAFGRGWTHNWDYQLSNEADGDVVIQTWNGWRFFANNGDGTFSSVPGDTSTLTFEDGRYVLQESDGTRFNFGSNGLLESLESLGGPRITLGYDEGQLTNLTHSGGAAFELTYNSQGRVQQLTDHDNRVTTYSYDTSGEHLIEVTGPTGTFLYNYETNTAAVTEHALTSITYPGGTQELFKYDTQGRLLQESRTGGHEQVDYGYDRSGGLLVTNGLGFESTLLYNDAGQLGHFYDPLGRGTRVGYDTMGQVVSLTLPGALTYEFEQDGAGNLTQRQDPQGDQIQMSYTELLSRLASFSDELGQTTQFSYDANGNPTQIEYADGSLERFIYDADGLLSRSINRRDVPIDFTYDALGRVSSKTFDDGAQVDYTYDDSGNLTTLRNASGDAVLVYDDADRIAQVTYANGLSLSYTYDDEGRRSTMQYDDGFEVRYAYDEAGRLDQITDGSDNLLVGYSYDAAGRLSQRDLGNGTSTVYTYDAAGQLLSIVNKASDDSVNSQYDYTYDNAGRLTHADTPDGQWEYGYDAIGQLVTAKRPNGQLIQYRYDAAGNRVEVITDGQTTSYSTNELNQITQVGSAVYTYDDDGNLISIVDGDDVSTFVYNDENRLIEAVTPDGVWQYEYDAFGNRIATIKDGQRTEFLSDPFGLTNTVAELDANGQLVARYIHGLGLVGRIDAGGNSAYYDFDAVGSTVGLTGDAGDYVNQYSYSPFGEPLNVTETVSNPFRFVGQWGAMHEGNGLSYMRARYYNPATGSFVSADPIGLAGGHGNLYIYAGNTPNARTDPQGTTLPLALAGGAIGGLFGGISYGIGSAISGNFSWRGLGGAVVGGAVFGGVVGATGGALLPSILAGGGSSALGYTIENGGTSSFSWGDLGVSAGVGAATGWIPWKMLGFKGGSWGVFAPGFARTLQGLNKHGLALWRSLGVGTAASFLLGQLVNILRSVDPNDILGPEGFGPDRWVPADSVFGYTIRFENDPEFATAPAQVVRITQQLDDDLDFRTFRVGDFGFGDLLIEVPDNRAFFTTRIDLTEELGILVDFVAGIDVVNGEAFWEFSSIDPDTGEAPTDALAGFLPPNLEPPEGDGFVTYAIRPRSSATSGDVVDAEARIVFDTNEPIDTPPIFNTLDSVAPTSAVNALSATVGETTFTVSWEGLDDPDGSGVADFSIWVSENGESFEVWLEATSLTEAPFVGQPGKTYDFYSITRDNAGNVEAVPDTADATTTTPSDGPATVVERHIFYNNSFYDENDSAINEDDDNAIAIDKSALRPNEPAGFANYTSYSRGINGIMIDILNPLEPENIDANDFVFRVGNNSDPSGWSLAPSPSEVRTRSLDDSGTQRVTITWPDNDIEKQWLQVKVLANDHTGLADDDVFYFGNAIGETGDNLGHAMVNATDELLVRINPHSPINRATVTGQYDFNRDSLVNATDELLARFNATSPVTALRLFTTPSLSSGAPLQALASTPLPSSISSSHSPVPAGEIDMTVFASSARKADRPVSRTIQTNAGEGRRTVQRPRTSALPSLAPTHRQVNTIQQRHSSPTRPWLLTLLDSDKFDLSSYRLNLLEVGE